jgi:hypothetical protein
MRLTALVDKLEQNLLTNKLFTCCIISIKWGRLGVFGGRSPLKTLNTPTF